MFPSLFLYIPLQEYGDIILLFIRGIMGFIMIYFGWKKLKNPSANAQDFVNMGFQPGWLWGTIVLANEFLGGILMLSGMFVWLIALTFGFQVALGTLMKVMKWKKPFSDYSYDLLLLALALIFLAFGPGTYVISF